MDVEDITLINLKVMGKLDPHVKIDTQSSLFKTRTLSRWQWPDWIRRWFNGTSREVDISKIQQLYSNAFSLALGDSPIVEQITKDLKRSVRGLKNLKITYDDDTTMAAQIDLIISKVENIIGDDKDSY